MKKNYILKFSIFLAIICFFSINILSNNFFKSISLDTTNNKLYTISEGTKKFLKSVEEPIHMRLFMSSKLVEIAPQLSNYSNRVETLLSKYSKLSDGKITLEIIDPKPFSDQEDRAVGMGISAFGGSNNNDPMYFGLAATNSTIGQKNINVFSPDREPFLEYDITRLIAELAQTKKPVISIIDNIGLEANSRIGKPEQQILVQMKALFNVEFLKDNITELPANTKVLMLVNPKYFNDETLFMIEQWILNGGSTLIFLDPYAETEVSINPGMPPLNPRSDLKKLLQTWEINFDNKKSIADRKYALRTVRNIKGRDVEVSNYPWIQVTSEDLNQTDGILAQLSNIVLTNSGSLSANNVNFEPLITSSEDAGLVDSDKAGDPKNDPRDLIKDIKISKKKLIIAGWLRDNLNSAFPKGFKDKNGLKNSKIKSNVLLVGDADMLMDRNWLSKQNLLGQEIVSAFANNGDFVLNAIESMIGGSFLSEIRGKGISFKPFTKIVDLEKSAEQKFLSKERKLVLKLEKMENNIQKLTKNKESEEDVLSPETIKAIEGFKSEMMSTRAELRNVKFQLRNDVDNLKTKVMFINIGLLPIFIAAIALIISIRKPKSIKKS